MDWLLITIGLIVLLIGIIGAILPAIPGPAVAYVSLFLIQLSEKPPFSERFLIIMGLIMLAVTIIDYIVPIYGTKKFGGSRAGIRGSTIGLIISIIILPILGLSIGPFGLTGIILGPFIGAYIGEISTGKRSEQAMQAAIGSFIGFIAGTFMKVAYTLVVAFYFFKQAFFV